MQPVSLRLLTLISGFNEQPNQLSGAFEGSGANLVIMDNRRHDPTSL
jgi:hypothetical protein